MRTQIKLGFIFFIIGWFLVLWDPDQTVSQTSQISLPADRIEIVAKPLAEGSPDIYQKGSEEKTWIQDIATLFSTKVYPNLPGALLLLFFSIFFSTINFFSDLPEEHRSIRRTRSYLFLWISVNYIFAMIFLFLILPSDTTMNEISKNLLLYCIVATALPELSANIRLQIGSSSRQFLDIYKYKVQFSHLITQKIERASHQKQNQDLYFLECCYSNNLPQFQRKLDTFVYRNDVFKNPEEMLKLINGMKSSQEILDIMKPEDRIRLKLLEFFREDIEQFRCSPICELISRLKPTISLQEAQKLVENGVTSSRGFIWRTFFSFQRKKLAEKTKIPIEKVNLIYFTTRTLIRKKRGLRVNFTLSILILIFLVTNLITWHAGRTYITLEPGNIQIQGPAPISSN